MRESMPCSDCLAADQCIVPMPAVTLMRLSCVIYLPKMVHYRVLMSRPDQSLQSLLNDPEHTDYALGDHSKIRRRTGHRFRRIAPAATNRHYYG